MGSVHLAELLDGARPARLVAVKVLHPHLAGDDESVAMFLDEARVAARIDHPNVVRVHDLDFVGQEIVIVMEYIEGVSLSALLRRAQARKARLPVPVVARIVDDALHGLHAAHEVKDTHGAPLELVHRDVTPHNVIVGTDGRARITDFGVATAAGRLAATKTGTVKGKLHYLSPEQVVRKPLDRRVDVFASGVVLWECLVGRRLFDGGTEAETLAMVLRGAVEPPSAAGIDLPIELEEACLKALERAPERRFATADAFARALEALDAPMATHEEVAALVADLAAEAIATQRALLHAAPPEDARAAQEAIGAEEAKATDGPSARTPQHRARPRRRIGVAIGAIALAAGALGLRAVTPRSTASADAASRGARTIAATPSPVSAEPLANAIGAPASSAAAAGTAPSANAAVDPAPPSAPHDRRPVAAPGRAAKPPPRPAGTSASGAPRHAAPGSSRPFMPSDL